MIIRNIDLIGLVFPGIIDYIKTIVFDPNNEEQIIRFVKNDEYLELLTFIGEEMIKKAKKDG